MKVLPNKNVEFVYKEKKTQVKHEIVFIFQKKEVGKNLQNLFVL